MPKHYLVVHKHVEMECLPTIRTLGLVTTAKPITKAQIEDLNGHDLNAHGHEGSCNVRHTGQPVRRYKLPYVESSYKTEGGCFIRSVTEITQREAKSLKLLGIIDYTQSL